MQGIRHTDGSQARMELHKVLSVVSSDVDVLAVHGDERSHEEISKGISTIPGRDRTGSLQETSADPSKCNHDRLEKVFLSNLKKLIILINIKKFNHINKPKIFWVF